MTTNMMGTDEDNGGGSSRTDNKVDDYGEGAKMAMTTMATAQLATSLVARNHYFL
jgi:hypothetical protein